MALCFALSPILVFTGTLGSKIKVAKLFAEIDDLEMTSRFDTLSLPWNEFSYLKKGSEIEIDNKKYDIYAAKRVGDCVIAVAFIDEVESAMGNFIHSDKSSNGPNSKYKTTPPDWVGLHFYSYLIHGNLPATNFPHQHNMLTKGYQNIVLPPPESIA